MQVAAAPGVCAITGISWLVYEYPQAQVYLDVPFTVQVAGVTVVFVYE